MHSTMIESIPVKTRIYTDTSVFDDLKSEWNHLLKHSPTNTIFNTWEWATHWWHAYHPGDLWVMTFRDGDNRLLGIAPFYLDEHPEHGKRVMLIGGEDVTDYLDIIVDRECTEAVYSCLAQTLKDHCSAFDVVDLWNIPAASPAYTQLPNIFEHYGFQVNVTQNEVCPLIHLPETFDNYLDQVMDSKQGREIRRKLRKAEGYNAGMGTLSWYIVEKTHHLETEIERFMKLMASSHPEKAHFLTNAQHVQFFRSIIPAALENGWLQLNFLMVDGEVAATYFNFDYNNHILVYNSGLNPNKHAHLSPGIILLVYNIQYAIDQKRATFDFLRGNEQYKYRMGAVETIVYNLKARL